MQRTHHTATHGMAVANSTNSKVAFRSFGEMWQACCDADTMRYTSRCNSPRHSSSSSPAPPPDTFPNQGSPPLPIPFPLATNEGLSPAPPVTTRMFDTMTFNALPTDVEYEFDDISASVRQEIKVGATSVRDSNTETRFVMDILLRHSSPHIGSDAVCINVERQRVLLCYCATI